MSAEVLNFLSSVTSALAWPTVVLVLLLVYRKPVKSVIEAIALRVPKVKEVAVPGASASFFEEGAQEAREQVDEIAEEKGDRQAPGASAQTADRDDAESTTHNSDANDAADYDEPDVEQDPADRRDSSGPQRPTLWEAWWGEIYGLNNFFDADVPVHLEAARATFVEKNLKLAKSNPRASVAAAFRHLHNHVRRVADAQGLPNMFERLGSFIVSDRDFLEDSLGLPDFVAESIIDLASLAEIAREEADFRPSVASIDDYATAVWNISYTLGQYANNLNNLKSQGVPTEARVPKPLSGD